MELSPYQLDTLKKWFGLKNELERVKAEESLLRDELIKELFKVDKEEGSQTIELTAVGN